MSLMNGESQDDYVNLAYEDDVGREEHGESLKGVESLDGESLDDENQGVESQDAWNRGV